MVQKTAEATGDLIGDKIADKITSVGKSKEKKEKTKKVEENYIPPEKKTKNNWWIWIVLSKNGISNYCKFTKICY